MEGWLVDTLDNYVDVTIFTCLYSNIDCRPTLLVLETLLVNRNSSTNSHRFFQQTGLMGNFVLKNV